MKNPNRRKIWFIIFASCLVLSLVILSYNRIQIQELPAQKAELEEVFTQTQSMELLKEQQLQMLELTIQEFRYQRNSLISGFFSVVFGVLAMIGFIRWKRQVKAIDPHALIDEIGRAS